MTMTTTEREAKLRAVDLRVAQRRRLERIPEALARIAAALEHALAAKRRSEWSTAQGSIEARLLPEVRRIADEVDALELYP
jgi:hypothetical protein